MTLSSSLASLLNLPYSFYDIPLQRLRTCQTYAGANKQDCLEIITNHRGIFAPNDPYILTVFGYVHVCVYVCICVYMCVYVYMCIYVYIYIIHATLCFVREIKTEYQPGRRRGLFDDLYFPDKTKSGMHYIFMPILCRNQPPLNTPMPDKTTDTVFSLLEAPSVYFVNNPSTRAFIGDRATNRD